MTYYLPPWQRGQIWTPTQQVALCETIWNGLPLAPFLFWARQTGPGIEDRAVVVLDGQQRLCALGADVRRHDGTPCAPTAARLDLETGRWGVNVGSDETPITMRHLASTAWLSERVFNHRFRHDERIMDLVCDAEHRVTGWTGVVYAMGLGFTPELATEVFRSWNIPGEPIPASEIEALIASADLGWSP